MSRSHRNNSAGSTQRERIRSTASHLAASVFRTQQLELSFPLLVALLPSATARHWALTGHNRQGLLARACTPLAKASTGEHPGSRACPWALVGCAAEGCRLYPVPHMGEFLNGQLTKKYCNRTLSCTERWGLSLRQGGGGETQVRSRDRRERHCSAQMRAVLGFLPLPPSQESEVEFRFCVHFSNPKCAEHPRSSGFDRPFG